MTSGKSQRSDFLIPLLTVAVDCLAIEWSFLLSYWLRTQSGLFGQLGFVGADAPPVSAYFLGSLFIIPVWLLLFQARRMYGARRNVPLADEFINIVKVVTLGMLVVMSAAFFYRAFSFSRIVFGLLWINAVVWISLGRVLVLAFERRLYRRGKNLQHAIIVGNNAVANEIHSKLDGHPSFGFHIRGYFADEPASKDLALVQVPFLGSVHEAPAFVQREGIDLVFIALGAENHPKLVELITECEGLNIEFMMVPDVLELLTSQVRVKELEGVPFLKIKSIPFTVWGRIMKRTFDIVVGTVLLILLSPLWVMLLILVPLTSRGPALFKQERIGLDGRKFTMYKFRSMRQDAELHTGPTWTSKDDPRRTNLGVFMRKTSLDELPQLFNVLRGDMSLVGPRPERPYFVDQFRLLVPKYVDRHRVKTGMTGWAQVNGLRGDTSLEDRIKYDLYYIENWSLGFDVKILLRTGRAAFKFREVH